MSKRTVAIRLGLTFAVVIGMLAFVEWLTLSRLNTLREASASLYERHAATLQLVEDARTYSNRNNRVTLQVFLVDTRPEVNALLRTRAQNSEVISQLLVKLGALANSAEEGRLLGAVSSARAAYVHSYLFNLERLQGGHRRVAQQAMSDETLPLLATYDAQWESYERFQKRDLDASIERNAAEYRTTQRLGHFLIALAVAFTIACALFVTGRMMTEVSHRQRAEEEVLNKNEELERRVLDRTATVERTNEELRVRTENYKLAEEAASENAAQYQRLVSNIPDVTWTCDRQGRILYVSPNCAKVFGLTPEQMYEDHGASWFRRIDPDDKDRMLAAFDALFEIGVPYDQAFRFRRSDGQWVWARSRARSTYQENGNAEHKRVLCDGVISEITEQKRIDEELRSKKALLEAITDSVAEAILVIDADGTKVLQNKEFKSMFRVPEHTLRDQDDRSLFEHAVALMKKPEEFREKVAYLYAHRDEVSLDVIEMKDGRVIDRHSAPVVGVSGQYYGRIWSFRDITQKKLNEDKLVQLSLAVEQSPASVVVTDLNGSISYVNRKFTECTGYSSADVIGQTPRVLKSGHTSSTEYRELWETITQGREWCGEFQNKKKNGELYWESATIRPIIDKNGTVSSFLALKEDITQKKHIEGQLRQAQKLEAVGQLAAGIAHEINTPAQYVANNTTFLKESWACIDKLFGASQALRDEAGHGAVSPDSLAQFDQVLEQCDLDFLRNEIPSAIDQSIEGLERVTKIVKAMKEFSHPGSDEKVAIDINKAIETTIAVAKNEWKYVADVTTELETDLPLVPCLRGEFNQAILNLIVNAAHAIAGVRSEGAAQKGEIAISTRRYGGSVEISVRDTGHGIPLEIQPRIFEPFFTTKEVGKGTGQGLSIAHNTIVKRLHGEMWFESELGLGATFFMRLPLGPAPTPA